MLYMIGNTDPGPFPRFEVCEERNRDGCVVILLRHNATQATPLEFTDRDWRKLKDLVQSVVVPRAFPVQPVLPDEPATDRVTCGTCGRSWDDAIVTHYTPVPAARCPFEHWHAEPRE